MNRLLGWTVPLVRQGGRLVALKGQSAVSEVQQCREQARLLGMDDLKVGMAGIDVVNPPTTVIWGLRISA